MRGGDIIGIADTGTGKTAAFLIPILDQLLRTRNASQSLIVVPTRELALQVADEFKQLAQNMNFSAACFIGGTNIQTDLKALKRYHHLIIGTPGRLLDLMNRKVLNIRNTGILVLDEFDRMLDMGFVKDVTTIVDKMHSREQTMLFSATLDPKQEKIIGGIVKDPLRVSVSSGLSPADTINQDIIRVNAGENKYGLLTDLISKDGFDKVLIFAETKRLVNKLGKSLQQSGFLADVIHGNKSQNYRNQALQKFKMGSVKVLVATDVAARGLDVENISHVINYQLPMTMDSYIHRIGRTGRAGRTGQAYTFID